MDVKGVTFNDEEFNLYEHPASPFHIVCKRCGVLVARQQVYIDLHNQFHDAIGPKTIEAFKAIQETLTAVQESLENTHVVHEEMLKRFVSIELRLM